MNDASFSMLKTIIKSYIWDNHKFDKDTKKILIGAIQESYLAGCARHCEEVLKETAIFFEKEIKKVTEDEKT